MSPSTFEMAVFWSGIGHLALCTGSLYIPVALGWKSHLASLQPLLRQMFWTYACYIFSFNLSFGIVSILGPDSLLDHSFLAKSVTLFIALYWFARILIQFFYFDRSQAPKGFIYTAGEFALVLLFAAFTLIYFAAFLHNSEWL